MDTRGKNAYHNVAILGHPRFRHRHLPFSCFPVFVELTVGDRAPLDSELAHVDLVTRMFIIPPKLMVPHIERRIIGLEIVMAKLNSSGTKCDGNTGRLRGSIPDLGQ